MILKRKSGQTFSMGLNLIVLVLLIFVYVALSGKQTSTIRSGQVGDDAALLIGINAITDQAQAFTEEAAALAAESALSELARRGGMGAEDNCGISNGYSLWNTPEKTLHECAPDAAGSIEFHFKSSLESIMGTLIGPDSEPIDARKRFDIGLSRDNDELSVTATTPQPISIPILRPDRTSAGEAETYLSATTKMPDAISEIKIMQEGAQKILDNCAETANPYECATGEAYKLNIAPGATLKWKAGPCPGDLAPNDARVVQFCVQPDRRMLALKAGQSAWAYSPTLYKFALTVVKKAPLKIINFQANGRPESGKPADRAGMGIAKGQPLAYHGRVSSPGLDGLAVSLCAASGERGAKKDCQAIEPSAWGVDTYPQTQQLSVQGAWQPIIDPPFTLTFEARRKDQSESTAGIDIVPIEG